jgi:hypothetical protein
MTIIDPLPRTRIRCVFVLGTGSTIQGIQDPWPPRWLRHHLWPIADRARIVGQGRRRCSSTSPIALVQRAMLNEASSAGDDRLLVATPDLAHVAEGIDLVIPRPCPR